MPAAAQDASTTRGNNHRTYHSTGAFDGGTCDTKSIDTKAAYMGGYNWNLGRQDSFRSTEGEGESMYAKGIGMPIVPSLPPSDTAARDEVSSETRRPYATIGML